MLLKLVLTTLASFAMVAPALTAADPCTEGGPNAIATSRFSRVLVYAKHAPAASLPSIDPNHINAVNTGLITSADADQLTIDAMADFYAKYGIDLSVVVPDANGQRTTADVIMQPALAGLDKGTVLVSDSANPSREHTHSWYVVDYSEMFFFRTTGTVPGGEFAGLTFNAGDAFLFGYSNLVRNNKDWSISKNREKFKIASHILAKQAPNILGKRQFIIPFDVTDSDNNVGYWLQATSIAPENGVDFLQSRIIITWDCP